MVRLMRWLVGLMITSLSTVLAIKVSVKANKITSTTTSTSTADDDSKESVYYDSLAELVAKSKLVVTEWTSAEPHLFEINDKNVTASVASSGHRRKCISPSIDHFPAVFQDPKRGSSGGFLVLHVLLGMYACYALAIVCDAYFVPALQLFGDRLGLTSDVAGATLMAAGTSSPEFFESIIGAFITEGDIGVGTIVGSAVFNILAVTSFCALLTGNVVPLDWWPLTRDCAFYAIAVIALIVVIRDERIHWYESAGLLVLFVLYVLMMYFNPMLSALVGSPRHASQSSSAMERAADDKSMVNNHEKTKNGTGTGTEALHSLLDEDRTHDAIAVREMPRQIQVANTDGEDEEPWSPWTSDGNGGIYSRAVYFVTWPINIVFYLTIPNCHRKRWEAFYPLTFSISVLYIGALSYFVAWMVTVLGFTIGIPDTVMGITFLAIGTSVPEGCSSVIVCRKGLGNMAVSNSVGSNAFDILFCLGLPWLVKALAFSPTGYVQINSSGLVYTAVSLLVTVVALYTVVAACRFRLNLKVGIICLLLYLAFLTFASLVELNIFGDVNPPTCS